MKRWCLYFLCLQRPIYHLAMFFRDVILPVCAVKPVFRILPLCTVCVNVTVWFKSLTSRGGHCACSWVFLLPLSVILLSHLCACFSCLRSVRRGHVYPERTKARKDRFSHKALLPRPFQSSLSIPLSYSIRVPDLWYGPWHPHNPALKQKYTRPEKQECSYWSVNRKTFRREEGDCWTSLK